MKKDPSKLLLDPILHRVLDITTRAMVIIDAFGNIIYGNPAACQLLEYSEDIIKTKNIFEVNPMLSLLEWRKSFKQLTEASKLSQNEVLTNKGTIIPVNTEAIKVAINESKFCFLFIENLNDANRFKNLLSLTTGLGNIGAWEWDAAENQIFLTQAVFNLLNTHSQKNKFTQRELMIFIKNLFESHEVKSLFSECEQAIITGKLIIKEIILKIENSVPRTLLIHAIPQRHEFEDQATKLYGIVQDITSVTHRSDDMYIAEFTMDHSPSLIFWLKSDFSFYYANHTFLDEIGYQKSELKNLKINDLLLSKPGKPLLSFETTKKHHFTNFQTRFKRKDESTFPIELSVNKMVYSGTEYLIVHGKNLTEKLKQDILIDLFFHTLNHSKELIFWCREDGSFHFQNQTVLEKLGYLPQEFEQLSIFDCTKELNFSDLWEEDNQVFELECILITKNKQEIPVEVKVTFVDHFGERLLCILLHDISERKIKEKKLNVVLSELSKAKAKLESEKNYLVEEIASNQNFQNIISKSLNYKKVLGQVARVAESETTVLITGETGTGKELLARAIHNLSPRKEKTMIKVNCAVLPKDLIESELFGHEKGAFTGAYRKKIGRFELANNGTLFLDEIGELPLELQSKLLRVLQEGEFERLGSAQTIKVDVRIITATNRDLENLVAQGQFREDLYYRINVFPIYNIPLRERKEDIPLLVQHFVEKYAKRANKTITKIPQGFIKTLLNYDFPGNIRELENIVERSIIYK